MTPHFPDLHGLRRHHAGGPARRRRHDPLAARALRQPGLAQPRLGLGSRGRGREGARPGGRLINADPREIVWTSGATESINLAIKGAAHFYSSRGKHLITVKTEHKATLDTMRELERQGFEVTYLDVQEDGLLDLDKFKAALRKDTILVSVMLVNNEIGVIQDIPAIGAMCRERGIIFHVDAAQATGKVAIDMNELPVDLMSLASHKTYGPKGIGALYVRRKPRVRLEAQMHGGGHERGMRSGTLPTHQCVGMGEAFASRRPRWAPRASASACCSSACWGISRSSRSSSTATERRVPHNVNASFNFVEGESLIMGVKGIAVSSGSACTSPAWSPATCCAPWAAATNWRIRACA
jgi:cysteine desulfurase